MRCLECILGLAFMLTSIVCIAFRFPFVTSKPFDYCTWLIVPGFHLSCVSSYTKDREYLVTTLKKRTFKRANVGKYRESQISSKNSNFG